MKTMKTLITGAAASVALMFGAAALPLLMPSVLVTNAFAADSKTIVDNAKAQGTVGERADGYLGVVTSASSQVQSAVDEINIRRKSVYTKLAAEQNISVTVVAALTGEKLLAKAKSGQKIMTTSGSWTTK